MGLIIGVAFGVLLLIGAGGAFAYYKLFGGRGPEIATTLPKDTELFLEIPNLRRLALDAYQVDFIDKKSVEEDKLLDDAVAVVSESFELSKDDAKALLYQMESLGVGARKLHQRPQVAFVFGFGSKKPVEALLSGKRFQQTGSIGDTGQRYVLNRGKLKAPTADTARELLTTLHLSGTRETLAWFPKQQVVVAGTEALVSDMAKVIEQGADSLEKNELFSKARGDFGSDARLVAFLDPTSALAAASLIPSAKQLIDGYFKRAEPITAALRLKNAGAVLDLTVRAAGPELESQAPWKPVRLDLVKRLPAETFAYVAVVTKGPFSGAEQEKQLFDALVQVDEVTAKQAELGLRETEQLLGVSFAKLVDSLGTHSVIGVAAPENFSIDPTKGPQQLHELAVFAVLDLADEAPLKTALSKVREQFGAAIDQATIKETSDGYLASPNTDIFPVSLHVKFLGKQLAVALGSNTLVEKGLKTLASGGPGSLETNAAHEAALSTLPDKAHALVWVDAGRVADTLLKTPYIKAAMKDSGQPFSKLHLAGDKRLTSAIALNIQANQDVWAYRLHTLNVPALGALGAAGALLGPAFRFGPDPRYDVSALSAQGLGAPPLAQPVSPPKD